MGMQPSDNGAATVVQCLPGRTFTAEPINANPRPREQVVLALGWPDESRDIVYGTVRVQTDIFGAWVEVARLPAGPPPTSVVIGAFDRPTPVSFRVNVTLAGVAAAAGGAHVLDQLDQWGYFQVRSAPDVPPLPAEWSRLDPGCERPRPAAAAIDVLAACVPYPGIAWVKPGGASLRSLPASQYDAFSTGVVFPSDSYRVEITATPISNLNGMAVFLPCVGVGAHYISVLLGHRGDRSAFENIDGKDSGDQANPSLVVRPIFAVGVPATICIDVRVSSFCDNLHLSTEVVSGGVNQLYLSWVGPTSRVSMNSFWSARVGRGIALSALNTEWEFSRISCVPLQFV
jgi:hypothetical protein